LSVGGGGVKMGGGKTNNITLQFRCVVCWDAVTSSPSTCTSGAAWCPLPSGVGLLKCSLQLARVVMVVECGQGRE
jgi:hypothetical protein